MLRTLASVAQVGGRWHLLCVRGYRVLTLAGSWREGGGPTAALPGKGPSTVPANPAKTHSSPKQDPAPAALNWQDTEGQKGLLQCTQPLSHHLSWTPLTGPVPSPETQHWYRIRQISSDQVQCVINLTCGALHFHFLMKKMGRGGSGGKGKAKIQIFMICKNIPRQCKLSNLASQAFLCAPLLKVASPELQFLITGGIRGSLSRSRG